MKTRAQSGTALVICMILLAVLSLLATSTMGTAALELAMAGNDQYSLRAFAAAEIGIERAIAAIAASAPTTAVTLTATLDNADSYTVTIRPRGATPPPPGYSATFTAEHFEIESTGLSLRDAKSTHIQGLFVIRPPSAAPTAAVQSLPPMCMPGVEIRPNLCANIGTPVRTYWRPDG